MTKTLLPPHPTARHASATDSGHDPRKEVRTQEQRSQQTRIGLLEAASICIGQHGYAGLRLSDIAMQAGVTIGALQHHFLDKDDLMRQVVACAYEELRSSVEQQAQASGPIAERVAGSVALMRTIYHSAKIAAAFEIIYAKRDDKAFLKTLAPAFQSADALMDQAWQTRFADSGKDPATLAALRHFARTTIQGLHIQRRVNPGFDEEEVITVLSTMLLQNLS